MSTIPLYTHRYIGLRNSCWAEISVFLMVIHDCIYIYTLKYVYTSLCTAMGGGAQESPIKMWRGGAQLKRIVSRFVSALVVIMNYTFALAKIILLKRQGYQKKLFGNIQT